MTVSDLRSFIAHAPKAEANPDIAGWWVAVEGGDAYVCSHCAGRIMARGCHLGAASVVFRDAKGRPEKPVGVCVCY